MEDFWVFGYGSLMWRPGFAHVEQRRARLHGYRRALCIHSWVHRGTQARPGLVLGLDRGGSCIGLAFHVAPPDRDAVLAYLRERELVTNVYLERRVAITIEGGRRVDAVTYVADTHHEQYAGALHADQAARQVRGAVGQAGPNEEYVFNTIAHLQELAIRDHWLEAVGALLKDEASADPR